MVDRHDFCNDAQKDFTSIMYMALSGLRCGFYEGENPFNISSPVEVAPQT